MNIKRLTSVAISLAFGWCGTAQTVTVETVLTGLDEPYGIVVDSSTTNNYCYITDSVKGRIMRFTPATGEQLVLTSGLLSPQGIVLARGGLVVSDAGDNAIYQMSTRGGALTRLIPSVQLLTPTGLAVDKAGNLYVADSRNNRILKVSPADQVTVHATGLDHPTGLSTDQESGRLFVADTGNSSVKVVEPDGSVKVVAGTSAAGARGLLWLGGNTGLLISDTGGHCIRKAYLPFPDMTNNWEVADFAGAAGVIGFANGSAAEARFHEPVGLAVDMQGALYVADLKNDALRRIVRPAVKTPVLKPPGGRFSNDVMVAVASLTTNAVFHYTTDGSEPTPFSLRFPDNLLVDSTTPIRVRAFSSDLMSSEVISNRFDMFVNRLEMNQLGGGFTNDVALTAFTLTTNASIHFTTNTSEPTTESPSWVNRDWGQTGRLKLRAFRDGFEPSEIQDLNFTFTVAQPIIWPPGPAGQLGETNNPFDVRLECGTLGATIYYVISKQQSLPTPENGIAYDPAKGLRVAANGLLWTTAYKDGYNPSALTSVEFKFRVSNPVIEPNGKTSDNPVLVTLSDETQEAGIYWTIDGSEPSKEKANRYVEPWDLGTNGTLKVRAYRDGFESSAMISATFGLKVGKPALSPAESQSDNPVSVEFASSTVGAVFAYTTDGKDPSATNGIRVASNPGSIDLAKDCTLKVIALKDGFEPSDVASGQFTLKAADPVISPAGAKANEPVQVTLGSDTKAASFRWTIDGSEPSATNGYALAQNPGNFILATNGLLKAVALQEGFKPSVVVSNAFALQVAKPVVKVTPDSAVAINKVDVEVGSPTPGSALLHYTTDGSDPDADSPVLAPGSFSVVTNTVLKVVGLLKGFADSETVERNIQIQVAKPVMTPQSGYFPEGVTVSLQTSRTNAFIFYTVDGAEPTTNSILYTAPFIMNCLIAPGRDLRSIVARAFAPNTIPSEITSGEPAGSNVIAMTRTNLYAGVGATIIVPVVATLKSGDILQSLQYKILAYPVGGAAAFAGVLQPLGPDTNAFIPWYGGTREAGKPVLFETLSRFDGKTNVMETVFPPPSSNNFFYVESFGTVGMLAVSIPTNAHVGDTYRMEVANPSGTSDGFQDQVELASGNTASSPLVITVTNISYLVGDTSPGYWYQAGDFGDGDLNNADFNNVLRASLGVRLPYPFTDVFDAMDSFPDDSLSAVGGDGQIRYLDWQRVLRRGLRADPNNWRRSWTTNGVRRAIGATLSGSPLLAADEVENTISGRLWPEAEIRGGWLGQALPGQRVSVPIRVNTVTGASLCGLQFRAVVEPSGNAPTLNSPVSYAPEEGWQQPLQVDGLPANQVGVAWSPLLNPLPQPLAAQVRAGHLEFDIPASAKTGQMYVVRFENADGAPDLHTQYDFMTTSGVVTVGAPVSGQEPPPAVRGFRVRWQGVEGQQFAVESTTDLMSGAWVLEAEGLEGIGKVMEFIDKNISEKVKFYRVVAGR